MDDPCDDGPCEITVTAPDRIWLQAFALGLVEDGLAAAAHLDQMSTAFRWKDSVHSTIEARVRLHTQLRAVDAIVSKTNELHPYEVACVSAVPILAGSPDYLDWIDGNVIRNQPATASETEKKER